MKKITNIAIKLDEEECGTCRFFKAGDMDLFCIEIPDDLVRHYAYDNLSNVLDGNIELAKATEGYLNQLYAHQGLKQIFLLAVLEDEEEYEVYSFEFIPEKYNKHCVPALLNYEMSDDDEINELYDVFPPSILMDREKKIARNLVEYLRTEPEGKPTLFIDGEDIPDEYREGIINKNHGLILLTKRFRPEDWNVTDVYEYMEKEDE